jgi:hypothetical protein
MFVQMFRHVTFHELTGEDGSAYDTTDKAEVG